MNKVLEYGKRGLQSILLPVLVYVLFYILTAGKFGQPATMLVILRQSVFPVFLAFALMPNMAMGMWDFSAGAVVYAGAIIGGNIALRLGIGVWGLILACSMIGILFCAVTGLLYNLLRLPSLVLTIGLCMVYEAAVGVIGGETYVTRDLTFIAKAPYCFIIFAIGFVFMYLVFNRTAFGHNVRAIGANQAIAKSTGIDVTKIKFLSFVLSGLFIGLSSLMYIATNAVAQTPSSMGSLGLIFDAMMGVYIGQFLAKYCNLVIGVSIGAFTIKMLSVALVAMGLTSSVRDIITGLFLLVLLCVSSNQNLLNDMRKRKADADAANREYYAKHENAY